VASYSTTRSEWPGVQVVAVCDLREGRKNEAVQVVSGGTDDTRLDAQGFNIAILEMGKHLCAEKPLALPPSDGTAEQACHDPARNAAEMLIQKGGIGKVLAGHP
jgi:hypothetical protein